MKRSTNPIALALAKNLKDARKAAGITQQEASERLGIPRSAMSLLENGFRAVSTLELANMSKLYGQPIWKLFPSD